MKRDINRAFAVLASALLLVSAGCERLPSNTKGKNNLSAPGGIAMHGKRHEVVDIERWVRLFPLEDFERKTGPRKFVTSDPDDPVDLWKAHGRIIVSPADLAVTEQVRRRVAEDNDLDKAVPTDIFLPALGDPKLPYLTKIGGIPYRSADRPWPTARDGTPLTFLAQFCFLDSKDIVPRELPGDVMLLFIRDWDSLYAIADKDQHRIEWSRVPLANPVDAGRCPKSRITIPNYYGVIHRTDEYPESEDLFRREGHYQYWLFARTQATRIGEVTHFIQDDPRRNNESLLCTLNSMDVRSDPFPLVNVFRSGPREPADDEALNHLLLGDCGCMYFLLDPHGNVRWTWDCY